jgi:hypothetical protein
MDELATLERDGFVVLRDQVTPALTLRLHDALDDAIRHAAEVQRAAGVGTAEGSDENPDGADGALGGAAHHCVVHGGPFLELLETLPCLGLIQDYLGGGQVVLNAYGGVSNRSDESAYEHAKLVHRDTRSHHPGFRQLLWLFVLLDDFTVDNGGTWMMPGSWTRPERPDDEAFYAEAAQVVAPAGSIALMDGRTWHAAGQNRTPHLRRLLTLAFSRPFVKPQLDYCRAFGPERVAEMPERLQQLLGHYARVPANLGEWYTRPEDRFYRSSQG